jgi:cobalt-zinc-cadmium efflux system protein
MAMTKGNNNEQLKKSERNLFITIGLNLFITVIQVVGGIISGSLSLISDAMHNLSDAAAIIITSISLRLSKKPKTTKYTFGLKRAEILAAVINSSTLIIISFFLIKEAIDRLNEPTQIAGSLMLIVAIVGFIPNVIGASLLKKGSEKNINIRAAYFHLVSDAISSVAIIIGAIFIITYKVYWIDPILTILIAFYILVETYKILKESVDILMMSNTEKINLDEIKLFVEKIPGVKNIHHIHLWKLNDNDTHFEAHIEVEDMKVSRTTEIQKIISKELHNRYEINHTTLQFECEVCGEFNVLEQRE